MEYLGAWGTLIHEKNLKSEISCQTPFKARYKQGTVNLKLNAFFQCQRMGMASLAGSWPMAMYSSRCPAG